MSKHTPEPWAKYDSDTYKTLSAADYERARACVNACTGIPTSALSEGCVGELVTALRALFKEVAERDPLYLDTQWASVPQVRAALAPFTKEGSDQ